MAFVSVGYDGSVGESVWGGTAGRFGSPEGGVAGDGDLDVTLAGDGVQVAAGTAYGWGVTDTTTGETCTFVRPPSGVRFDAVALRRDWTVNTSSLVVVQGGSERVLPTLQASPGVRADQALALVQVPSEGPLLISDDLRVTHGVTGVVRSLTAAQVLPVGSRVILDGSGARYQRTAAGVALDWAPPPPPAPQVPIMGCGTSSIVTNQYGSATIQHSLGWVPDEVQLTPRLASDSAMVAVYVSSAAGALTDHTINVTAKLRTATGWAAYAGRLYYVDWIATKHGTRDAIRVPTPDGGTVVTPGPDVPSTPVDDSNDTSPPNAGGPPIVRDVGVIRAPQIPIPDTAPIYKVPTPTGTSVAGILATAAAEIGVKESPSGSNKVKYWLDEKPSWNGSYWCAAFTAWVYRRNGISVNTVLGPPADSNPYLCSNLVTAAKKKGLWYTGTPRPGDTVLYAKTAGGEASHVEIVEKWIPETGRVQVIGGNTSDGLNGSPNNGGGVYRNRRNPKSATLPILGYIRMPTAVPVDLRVKGPFPLPAGHYYAAADPNSTLDHNGLGSGEKTAVMQIQAEVGAAIDGEYGPQTTAAVKEWQRAMFRPQTGRITADDWQVLLGQFTAPERPTGIVATAGVGTATVTFNASAGAQQYTAILLPSNATVTGTSSPITFTGLPAGKAATFQVVASNVGGASPRSATSNVVWPTEGSLATIPADDGSVFMTWQGSSKTPAMVGTVKASNLDATTYAAFAKALPAAKHTAAIQQAARNVTAILYDGATWPWPPTRSQVTLEFTSAKKLADAQSGTGVISMGRDILTARNVASWITHEVVHLFQKNAAGYGTDKYVTGLVEGIADYVCVILGYHDLVWPGAGANWWDGYDTTASFLHWVEREAPTPSPNFVRRLNAQLSSPGWTPDQIKAINARSMTVDALWTEYVNAKRA